VEFAFDDAYMTHTSTSPNYQILASLDVGRRQVELEGYELVQHSTELAMTLRERIAKQPHLAEYFEVLGPAELVPAEYRASGFSSYREVHNDWAEMDAAWESDEFCLDPTRITVSVGLTGIDGDSFKRELMERFDIQINKTSRNSVLFMTHIGTTRGSVAYLIDVFDDIAQRLRRTHEDESEIARSIHRRAVESLTVDLPPLPNFSRFAPAYETVSGGHSSVGDMRRAYFDAQDEANVEYLKLDGSIQDTIERGREVVAASFVTPYPPGFPILVPGQVISREILAFLHAVDVKEIHGYRPEYGLRVFSERALVDLAAQ
jgi:arginine decarboxylase